MSMRGCFDKAIRISEVTLDQNIHCCACVQVSTSAAVGHSGGSGRKVLHATARYGTRPALVLAPARNAL